MVRFPASPQLFIGLKGYLVRLWYDLNYLLAKSNQRVLQVHRRVIVPKCHSCIFDAVYQPIFQVVGALRHIGLELLRVHVALHISRCERSTHAIYLALVPRTSL